VGNCETENTDFTGERKDITEKLRLHHNKILRWVLMVTGTFLVALGVLGIFLPLLPTTIFFLLAAACYGRSSERFYRWLMNNRWFGRYIRSYRSGEGMTLMSKIFSLALMWAAILYSAVFAVENFYVRLILILIAVGVTLHLISLKTLKVNGINSSQNDLENILQ
jgi:uncharacterized membrane protein YbaN (DUF454 family)